MEAASNRCWAESPQGPAPEPLGKVLSTERMSKSGLSVKGSELELGITGGGQGGCLACNNCQVLSLKGATPSEVSMRHALLNKPERPRETAELITFLRLLGGEPASALEDCFISRF